jgi:hypothetical protein
LQKKCPQYRLNVKEVNIEAAKKAISMKRPVVARFSLIKSQWRAFSEFFSQENNPSGILTSKILDKYPKESTK